MLNLKKIREKFHPLLFLYSIGPIRYILKKFNFIFYKKSKKFGNYYCKLIQHLNLITNEDNYEKDTFEFILSLDKKIVNDSTFIDIGSNIGLFSFFIEKNFNSQIISFEPDKENLIINYKTQIKRKSNRIFTIPYGVSNSYGIKSFLLDDVSGSVGSLKGITNESQKKLELDTFIKVPTCKLNMLLNYNFKNINLIKIDIEGGEVDAINGGIELIKTHLPILIIETGGSNLEKIKQILGNFGYSHRMIDDTCSNYCFFNDEKFKINFLNKI